MKTLSLFARNATLFFLGFLLLFLVSQVSLGQSGALVFQSDFGLKDGAVAAMKGVAYSVSKDLQMFDITHDIEAYNIYEAAYRLNQTASYWPEGTVFVSIVDPGVGSARKSIVLKTKTGHFFVSPDNGTLTLVAHTLGVAEIREINEAINRLKQSEQSYTFHGRDVYAYTGARLAARVITYENVGPRLTGDMVRLPLSLPVIKGNEIHGGIPVLDVQYGNVWTNIDAATLRQLKIEFGDVVVIRIYKGEELKFENELPFVTTFGAVPSGHSLAYLNSLLNFSVAINQGNFADHYQIRSGVEWTVWVKKK